MATIKAFSDLEQSKKLAEILPLESADMLFQLGEDKYADSIRVPLTKKHWEQMMPDINPCWSLAALLNYLKSKDKFPEINELSDGRFKLTTYIWDGEHCIQVSIGDTIVDTCYEIIIKLNEQNLL